MKFEDVRTNQNMHFIKRSITPIMYTLFLLVMTALSVALEMVGRILGILPEYTGLIDRPMVILGLCVILIAGVPVFLLANHLIQHIEKPNTFTLYDHIRQSSLFYLMGIYSLSTWISHGFAKNEEDAYLLMWLGISIVAVVVNYMFIQQKKKEVQV